MNEYVIPWSGGCQGGYLKISAVDVWTLVSFERYRHNKAKPARQTNENESTGAWWEMQFSYAPPLRRVFPPRNNKNNKIKKVIATFCPTIPPLIYNYPSELQVYLAIRI